MENCIFCKIINNEIPSYKIYKDEYAYAFLDISPLTIGHTLVIPKVHHESILDFECEAYKNYMASVPTITKILKEKLEPIGFTILNNNLAPDQVVMHYHIHIIPRYLDDTFKENYNSAITIDSGITKEDVEKVYQKLSK